MLRKDWKGTAWVVLGDSWLDLLLAATASGDGRPLRLTMSTQLRTVRRVPPSATCVIDVDVGENR